MRISCKTCRRVGASVCGREKCAFRRKPYAPGIHGRTKKRRESSEFGQQLRNKQMMRFSYGVSEKQFRGYVTEALAGSGGDVVKKLVDSLELRLDNVVYRLGFAANRAQARQLVSHGHITVNGRKVFVSSYQTRLGDKIAIAAPSRSKKVFENLDITLKKQQIPSWLTVSADEKAGNVATLPKVEDVVRLYNLKSIIEYYSR